MSEGLLLKERTYLKEHQAELIEKYRDREYLLIKGEKVYGAYETYKEAVHDGVKRCGRGPFLVRSVYHPEDPEPVSIPALSLGLLFGVGPGRDPEAKARTEEIVRRLARAGLGQQAQ